MRPIQSLIDTKFLTKAQYIESLTTSVRSRLSPELRDYCWVADIIGNCLILITDSAERATVLRYQQHELVKQINEEFTLSLACPVKRAKIKIDYKLALLPQQEYPPPSSDNEKNKINRINCANLLQILNKT